jgi:RNA polymerase primary sigma factor
MSKQKATLATREFEADALDIYAQDVGRHSRSLLTREEEAELGARALAGDSEARDLLVTKNLRFVITVAKKFQGRGRNLLDLINDGNIGLIMAAERFDPSVGVRFVSYAIHWVIQQIQAGLDRNDGDVRPTQTQMVRVRKVRRLQREAEQLFKRPYTVQELRALTGYSAERIQEAMDYREGSRSFDAPTNPYDNSSPTLDEVLDLTADDPADAELANEQRAHLARMLREILDDRERRVVTMYYGLDGRREYSLSEAGLIEGISRERARQIKQRAVAKLREAAPGYPMLMELFVTAGRAQAGQGAGI